LCGILQIPRLIVTLLQIIGPENGGRLFSTVFRSLVLSAQTTERLHHYLVQFSVTLCSEKWINIINLCYKRLGCLVYYANSASGLRWHERQNRQRH